MTSYTQPSEQESWHHLATINSTVYNCTTSVKWCKSLSVEEVLDRGVGRTACQDWSCRSNEGNLQ